MLRLYVRCGWLFCLPFVLGFSLGLEPLEARPRRAYRRWAARRRLYRRPIALVRLPLLLDVMVHHNNLLLS